MIFVARKKIMSAKNHVYAQVLYQKILKHDKIILCKILCKEDVNAKKIILWKIMLDEDLLYAQCANLAREIFYVMMT